MTNKTTNETTTTPPNMEHHEHEVPITLTAPGVLPVFIGGLGNQLWIFSAAYAVSQTLKCPLYLTRSPPMSRNAHLTRDVDYVEVLLRDVGEHIGRDITDVTVEGSRGAVLTPDHAFAAWSPPTENPDGAIVVMASYFQYYPAIAPYELDIRSLLLRNLQPYMSTVRRVFARKTGVDLFSCVFVHVRRGDYLHLSHIHFVQPVEYFATCLRLLGEKAEHAEPTEPTDPTHPFPPPFSPSPPPPHRTVVVVSDDPAWCKTQVLFSGDRFVHGVDVFCPALCAEEDTNNLDELHTLAIMASCLAGAVCANSTFSWWGAFLGAHSAGSPVFVPKQWIASPHPECLHPPQWIQVDPSVDPGV